jgi:hypothetical protein
MQIRLFFITALIAVMGFAFVSPFFDSKPYNDGTPQVLVSEAQESFGDSDSFVPDATLAPPASDLTLVFASIYLLPLFYRQEVLPRLTFLYHIRPRSPPAA